MEKTIKQLADELGVSKQAIQKRINNLPTNKQPTKVGGKYVLNKEIIEYIYAIYQGGSSIDENQNKINRQPVGDNQTTTVANLEERILELKNDKKELYLSVKERNKQIENLYSLLETQQKLLDQQQILTLQANKKIEELELLNAPVEEKKSRSFIQKLFRKE